MRHGKGISVPRTYARCVGLLWAATLAGCDMSMDLTGLSEAIGGRLTSVDIYPDSAVVQVGDTLRLSATGGVSGVLGMLAYDPLADAVWRTSSSTVLRLETVPPPPVDSYPAARIRVRAMRAGEARVIVEARGFTATARVTIVATDSP